MQDNKKIRAGKKLKEETLKDHPKMKAFLDEVKHDGFTAMETERAKLHLLELPHLSTGFRKIHINKRDERAVLVERRPLTAAMTNEPDRRDPEASKEVFKRVQLKQSGLHGLGVFAAEDIRGDEDIIEYVGEIKRFSEATYGPNGDRERNQQGLSTFLFTLNSRYVIDSTSKGNLARWINHSCDPNCMVRMDTTNEKITICARRFIFSGEELTYDYALAYDTMECKCGADNCRGTMKRAEVTAKAPTTTLDKWMTTSPYLNEQKPEEIIQIRPVPVPTQEQTRVMVAVWQAQLAVQYKKGNK